MSALLFETIPSVGARLPAAADRPAIWSRLALIAGALAPWLLLVGLHGVLHRAASACIAGQFPA